MHCDLCSMSHRAPRCLWCFQPNQASVHWPLLLRSGNQKGNLVQVLLCEVNDPMTCRWVDCEALSSCYGGCLPPQSLAPGAASEFNGSPRHRLPNTATRSQRKEKINGDGILTSARDVLEEEWRRWKQWYSEDVAADFAGRPQMSEGPMVLLLYFSFFLLFSFFSSSCFFFWMRYWDIMCAWWGGIPFFFLPSLAVYFKGI